MTALTSGKILGLYRGQIVNSLNALANENFNREEKIRLTVSELRRKLGKSLNGHLENILQKMVAAAIIERRIILDEAKRWSVLDA